jgi:hypothetical protein
LLWRLFPPAEVSATRGYMREFLRRSSPTYPVPRELQERAIARTRDADYVVGLIRDERRTADYVALDMLASTASGLLTSGRYHIYRGVLSGEGHALTSTFIRCMTELQQRGYESEEQTQEAIARMRDEIRRLG